MNRTLYFLLIFASGIILSCKKGPEDPLFSLKSRTTRLAGKWRLETNDRQMVNSSRSNSFVTTTSSYEYTSGDSTHLSVSAYGETTKSCYYQTREIEFLKRGSYYSVTEIRKTTIDTVPLGFNDSLSEDFLYRLTVDSVTKIQDHGMWSFAGGNSELKSKELLLINLSHGSVSNTVTKTYVALNEGKAYDPENTNILETYSLPSGACEQWNITGLWDKKITLDRSLDSLYSKWDGNKFPVSVKISGSEKLVLIPRK